MKYLSNSKQYLLTFHVHMKPHRLTILARWSATGPATHGILPGPQQCSLIQKHLPTVVLNQVLQIHRKAAELEHCVLNPGL